MQFAKSQECSLTLIFVIERRASPKCLLPLLSLSLLLVGVYMLLHGLMAG